ncbi:MAG TPA: hypothetical protein VFR58_10410 [Flavisolibacter sp.]|nr:hypothetical protein [Flavisolibacter sp.]
MKSILFTLVIFGTIIIQRYRLDKEKLDQPALVQKAGQEMGNGLLFSLPGTLKLPGCSLLPSHADPGCGLWKRIYKSRPAVMQSATIYSQKDISEVH